MSNLGKPHCEAVNWILRYLQGPTNLKLSFGVKEPRLIAYSDSDLAGDFDCRKATSGNLVTHSDGKVTWHNRLQKYVALNTTEDEFIAITEATEELL
jgi:hypothetical protein